MEEDRGWWCLSVYASLWVLVRFHLQWHTAQHISTINRTRCSQDFCFKGALYCCLEGRNHGWKVEGTKVWVPTPWCLRLAPDQRPGWVLGAGRGRPLPLWGLRGYHPRKICENSDAKSCILVIFLLAVKFLAFWKARPRSWGTNTLLLLNLKVGGTSLPRSLRLLRLWLPQMLTTFFSHHLLLQYVTLTLLH